MESRKQKIKNWVQKNQRTTVFGICFMLSFSFWLLIKLSHDYNARVQLNLGYENIPEGKLLAEDPIQFIEADIDAPGFSLLKNWLNSFGRIDIDVSVLNTRKSNGIEKAYWVTNNQKQVISQQLSNGIKVVQVYPDTVFYMLSDLVERKVPVLVSDALQYKSQYRKRGAIKVEPDSIVVSGPKSIVDTISYVFTEQWHASMVDGALNTSLELRNSLRDNNIRYSNKKVDVSVEVDQITESEVEVLIQVKNNPEGFDLKVFPRKVRLTFLVALRDFKKISPEMFRAEVEFPDAFQQQNSLLSVKAISTSKLVDLLQTKPEKVEYIIRKK
ncbi:MAG: hypothetical protein ACI8P7_001160 [Candidatus Azotimanducaceae bacterium]